MIPVSGSVQNIEIGPRMAGMNRYLVGGAVRDELLGRPVTDRDYLVTGVDEGTFLSRFPGAKRVGRRAFVYIVDGHEYTISSDADVMQDLMRRDLTINAMAKDGNGRLIAHPRALADLQEGVLRPVAAVNFVADPLRLFRAARFAAEFPEFKPHATLSAICRKLAAEGLISTPAAERVGHEVLKACAAPRPSRFLNRLADWNALVPWLTELQEARSIPAGPAPYHNESLFLHTVRVMDALRGCPLTAWMGLCHDLGKAATPRRRWPQHHGHGTAGAALAEELGQRLKLPSRYVRAGIAAARWHMTTGRYPELRAGTKVRLLLNLHRLNLITPMAHLVQADQHGDHQECMESDLKKLLEIHLPSAKRNLGAASANHLHHLRCQALARS